MPNAICRLPAKSSILHHASLLTLTGSTSASYCGSISFTGDSGPTTHALTSSSSIDFKASLRNSRLKPIRKGSSNFPLKENSSFICAIVLRLMLCRCRRLQVHYQNALFFCVCRPGQLDATQNAQQFFSVKRNSGSFILWPQPYP